MSLTDDRLQKLLLRNICQHWNDGLYCDVTIICGADSVQSYKLILSSISSYFKSLFQHESNDTYSLDETIVSGSCLRDIILFAQTGETALDIDSVHELFIAADYLQIDLIRDKCEGFMLENMDKYNNEKILSLVQFADMYQVMSLLNNICCRISEDFYQIIEHKLFGQLTVNNIKLLLANENLSVFEHGIPVSNPECEILKAVGLYLSQNDCDEETRSYLLEEICFDEFKNPEDLKSIVKMHPILDCEKMQEIIKISTREIFSVKTDQVEDLTCSSDKKTRKYSNENKGIYKGTNHMVGYLEKWDVDSTITNDVTNRPVEFKIWVTSTPDDHESDTIVGICIRYQDGTKVEFRAEHTDDSFTTEDTFSLKEGEVITKVETKTDLRLYQITFFSNFENIYGPFGSNVGYKFDESSPSDRGYLHSFSTSSQIDSDFLFINFHWICFGAEWKCPSDYDEDDDEDNVDRKCVDSDDPSDTDDTDEQ